MGPVMRDWDRFFLGMAGYVASASKDPSTQVGAVIVRPDRTIASLGYNGFPRGVHDDEARIEDRPFKYAATVHAELNALLNAREPLARTRLYCTLHPCAQCAAAIVQAGVAEVTVPDEPEPDRWRESFEVARTILEEGRVRLTRVSACDRAAAAQRAPVVIDEAALERIGEAIELAPIVTRKMARRDLHLVFLDGAPAGEFALRSDADEFATKLRRVGRARAALHALDGMETDAALIAHAEAQP